MSIDEDADSPNESQPECAIRLPARTSTIGEGLTISRLLPHRKKRTIGAWCFFDHAGPIDVRKGPGVRVGPHPHTGLMTFSWMIEGEMLHRDSLGYEQLLRQGEVNLMTAGRGISHSEESPRERSPRLELAQFWIALPDDKRFIEPAFDHYPLLPRIEKEGATLTLLVGDFLDRSSPVRVFSPLIGVDIETKRASSLSLPLRPNFEYGVAALSGAAAVCEQELEPGTLLYLGTGRHNLDLDISEGSRLILLGGEPFAEELLLYWNFAGRSAEEIASFTELWRHTDHFGKVRGYDGPPLPAPDPPVGLRAKSQG